MAPKKWTLLLLLLLGSVSLVDGLTGDGVGNHQHRLYEHLLGDYEPLVRPSENETSPVVVSLGLDLQQIVDINEYEGYMETNSWLKFDWKDAFLEWDPADFGGVSEVRVPTGAIWKPDILMYNSANVAFDSTYPSNIIVYSTGDVNWIPPGVLKSSCKIDVTWFPFDDQRCTLKFGSWSYNGNQLELIVGAISTATYTVSGEWNLMAVTAERQATKYECCPEPYYDVTFTVWIRRRTLYYHLNLVIPCLLVSSLALFGFALPPNSGERIVLGITVFMALCITMMQTTDAMPKLSDAVPLISVFFSAVNVVVILQVVLTVVVLNYFYRSPNSYEMPRWVALVFLRYLPRLVLMEPRWLAYEKAQGRLSNAAMARRSSTSDEARLVAKFSTTSLASKSLLANVLDIEEYVCPAPAAPDVYASTVQGPNGGPASARGDWNGDCGRHNTAPSWLTGILAEVRFIAERMRKKEACAARLGDWVYAARVLDRASLLLCSSALVLGITRVLIEAPHIIA